VINESGKWRGQWRRLIGLFLMVLTLLPVTALSGEGDWRFGAYAGQYYDSEPAGFTQGNANYLSHYMLAVTASRQLWRSSSLPLALEVDGMIGHQFGLTTLNEIALAPALSWGGFPWQETLPTHFRVAPVGISYTSSISPLERGSTGNGSQTLNFLFLELAFSAPQAPSKEVFIRLHHRCAVYDLLNNYGANGEDFLAVGYRYQY
jgi:hypothetical protein